MRKIITGLNISLDGFIEGPNGEMNWLNLYDPTAWSERHADLWRQLDAADTLLIGRVTYQIWEQYWPAAGKNPASPEFDRKFAEFAEKVQKIVISGTLDHVSWTTRSSSKATSRKK